MSKESGKTCMNPVDRMIPEAKDLMITNKLFSGLSAGIERVNRGEHTPIMLAISMEKMAMILRGKAFFLSVQPPSSVLQYSSGATESACSVKMDMIIKRRERSLTSEAIGS